jgi:hypothetical protein
MVVSACHPGDRRKCKIVSQSRPAGEKGDPVSKTTRAKRIGGVTHVVECLSSKCEFLSSNSVLPKRKKRKRKVRALFFQIPLTRVNSVFSEIETYRIVFLSGYINIVGTHTFSPHQPSLPNMIEH